MKGRLNQFYTTFASSFGMLVMAIANVWPSYTTGLLKSDSTPLQTPLTKTEESLLGSLPAIGALLGSAICGYIIDKIGRKKGGAVISLFTVISWIIVAFTISTRLILVSRFLVGISGGAFLVFGPIFISEVAEDSIRGALASAVMFQQCVGILISYLMGWFMSYMQIIWANLGISIACCMFFVFVAESPMYFMKQMREEEAASSIAKYRGLPTSSKLVDDEICRLRHKINTGSGSGSIKAVLQPTSRRAFLILFTIISAQVFMGMMPVQVYAKTVFMETDPTRSDLYTVLFALTLVCGTVVTATVADRAGRRVLIVSSSTLVCLCMATLGVLMQTNVAPPVVSVLFILIFCFSFMYGAGSVPYVLLAEMFLPEVQNMASMLLSATAWLQNFVILALFPYLTSYLGMHGVLYAFAVISLGNAVFSYIFVPETKGLSKEAIQELLAKRT